MLQLAARVGRVRAAERVRDGRVAPRLRKPPRRELAEDRGVVGRRRAQVQERAEAARRDAEEVRDGRDGDAELARVAEASREREELRDLGAVRRRRGQGGVRVPQRPRQAAVRPRAAVAGERRVRGAARRGRRRLRGR